MWFKDEDPLTSRSAALERSFSRDVKIALPAPFAGDGSQSFLSWVRQLEVAVEATAGSRDWRNEIVRVLPTRLSQSAFLLWDSLPPTVQSDYAAVKEKLGDAFGQRQFMDRFRANLSARMRAPGESLEVYAADVSRLVLQAFPGYGDVAQREEKFRRFLAGLDPALKSKCLEQGATDLEEALTVAERCENARLALQRESVANTFGAPAAVQSVSASDGLLNAVDKLTEEMSVMRMEMKEIRRENQRLRAADAERGERMFRSPFRGGCRCDCGERGCQSATVRDGYHGRSPDRRPFSPQGGYRVPSSPRPSQGRSPSPNWRDRRDRAPPDFRPSGGRSPSPNWRGQHEYEPRRRNVRFVPHQQDTDGGHQGNDQ